MREYGVRDIKNFLIIEGLCPSKKSYDELKKLYETLLLSEVATLDWQKLENLLFMRATFFDFYHLTLEGLWLLEHLGKFENYNKPKSGQPKQLDLSKLLSNRKGVRA